ncbi:MAG: glycosyltransferase family 4 protein [Kineosporiaceae bacterium]
MRVLLVTHEASLSGAPRVAVLVAACLAGRGHDVRVVSRRPGPLLAGFREVAPCSVEPLSRVRRRLWRTGALRAERVLDAVLTTWTLLRHRPDLVYLNSTASAPYLAAALRLRCRVVLHSHESAEVARRFLAPRGALPRLSRALLVGCSPPAREDLAALAGVPAAEVVLLPSVPDAELVHRRAAAGPDPGFGAGEVVVGAVGSVEARKGTDLWAAAARRVRADRPGMPLRFVWVGGDADPALVGAPAPGEFLGPRPNPYPVMRRFDIATLPSRDDPFPLVVLEAMLLGVPVVAFAVGGVPEQVGDTGVLVPPGDVEAFAAAVRDLADDPGRRAELGRRARERAVDRFSPAAFRATLLAALEPRSWVGRR